MSEIFADTSSLVKYYYSEKDSARIETVILKARRVYVSSLCIVEMASALMKKVRTGDMRKSDELLGWNTFLDDLESNQMEVLVPDERQYERAADIVRKLGAELGIRALDALQIAVAQSVANAAFLCSDRVLAATASKMGMKVIA